MFKSIFSKLIVLFISIIIISFSITGIMLYFMLDSFVYSEKESDLKRNADSIIAAFYDYATYDLDIVGNDYLLRQYIEAYLQKIVTNEMEKVRQYTHSYVWIVDEQGYIGFAKPELNSSEMHDVTRKLVFENKRFRLPDEKQYRKVMLSGSDVVEKNDLYGLFGERRLTIEKPIRIKDNMGNEFIGAVYLSTSIPDVYELQRSIIMFYFYAVGISVIIVILLAYVFSRRISKPLKEINEAARVIAGGEFQKRLNIKSQDEIGELAVSFNNMIEALRNLEEMRRGFIANVSHELRTPMTSIRGFIEGILDGTIPFERQDYYLTIVRDEVNRMNRLVNDLLDLARMEGGEVKLNLIDFNINELIRRTVIKIESLLVSKNIDIEAYFESEDMYVNGDVDSIERVILNLVHNAVKFTQEDGKIKISTIKKRDKICVSIEDNGPGIDKDEISLIWDRFYKADKSRGKDKSGTGLGLAIVKNIISEHGQEISVESEPGHGAKFTFTLNKSADKGSQS
ncbi:sensor histidine kinase [Pseudobacteroides cellulosolvens]|uniref:histidine kinase n=1 Tax=Pseudobacteroides cellulosolvens ATCC 35603 = DSM 2933 TaxID=398512 RepID=A0A0L6JL26_9FIRM|nr:ATP-binding protein [Pseudobacteroides cellulosolvens]KNY26526.1 integral membrane sensor signal transduction histidine kinase [Pseudobacteroides cellulosolvens ATCC 35603 = DSM 2933]